MTEHNSPNFIPLTGSQSYARSFDNPSTGFIVISMFTPSIRHLADRLRASLDEFGLNYVIQQVPSVHVSISPHGNENLAFSKPNFIQAMLEELKQPVLFLDADLVVRQSPSKISDIASGDTDFAVYNWFADTANDVYMPVEVPFDGFTEKNRFYQFAYSINFYDPDQLLHSGAVQFYRNSEVVKQLLRTWLQTLPRYPDVVDDQLLDFVFNFHRPPGLRSFWLEKEYCRYAWWIHARPVIDHPQFPFNRDRTFFRATGKQAFDMARVKDQETVGPFPRSGLIDVKQNRILLPPPSSQWPATPIAIPLWISS